MYLYVSRNMIKTCRKSYSLPTHVKSTLIASIFECRVPEFTHSLVSSCPRNQKQLNRKHWTALVSAWLMDPRNQDVLQAVVSIKEKKKKDVYDTTRTIKNCLLEYNKYRYVFNGFATEPPKSRLPIGDNLRTKKENKPLNLKQISQRKKRSSNTTSKAHPKKSIWEDTDDSDTSSVDSMISPLKRKINQKRAHFYGDQDQHLDDSDNDPIYKPDKLIRLKGIYIISSFSSILIHTHFCPDQTKEVQPEAAVALVPEASGITEPQVVPEPPPVPEPAPPLPGHAHPLPQHAPPLPEAPSLPDSVPEPPVTCSPHTGIYIIHSSSILIHSESYRSNQ